MPRRPVRGSRPGRGRTWLVVGGVLLFVLITSLRGIASFYTDYLWFDSLGRSEVWRGVLGAKIALSVIFTGAFFLLMWVNLVIADRLAPAFRPAGPEEEFIERYHELVGGRLGLVRGVVSGAAGADRRGRRVERVELVAAVHPQPRLRHRRPAVRHRHRLLRLQAAVPELPRPGGCSRPCSSC